MCNLYHISPKGQFETYLGQHAARWVIPEPPARPFVGPFDPGMYVRADGEGGLLGEIGQWGLIRPGAPARRDMMQPKAAPGKKLPAPRPRSTNNARSETVATSPTFRAAWNEGRRCLIPAAWYQEPNWETGRNIWWQLTRADGQPWMLAGLWNHWVDPASGEIVPNFTMLTMNCDAHPLLARLHKPDPKLPADQQDKRAVVHIEPEDWGAWLTGTEADARAMLRTQPAEFFDQAAAVKTDALLAAS